MNSKASWILLALVLIAIFFVPLIPNDAPIDCNDSGQGYEECDDTVGYISLYTKYFGHK